MNGRIIPTLLEEGVEISRNWDTTPILIVSLELLWHPWLCNFTCWCVAVIGLFSYKVVPQSLWPHGLQHTRPPYLSPSPRVCPSSCSLHQWCCSAISSSDDLFSFCPWPFPALWSFPICHLFSSDDQNTGASASASVLPANIQCWSVLRLTGLISSLSKEFSEVFSSKGINYLAFFLLDGPALTTICDHWKTIALIIQTFVSRVMSLLFNTLSRFVITFLPRGSCLLISWLQSPSIVILEPPKGTLLLLPHFPLLSAMQ